jgi:membrane-associated protein
MMKLKWIVFFFATCITSVTNAQQQAPIKVMNQYESVVTPFTITVNQTATTYTSNNEGLATISIPTNDSVTIAAVHHQPQKINYQQISANNVLILQKEFTWKDLLNPMFYIVYGGLWLLLFIIFAETGLLAGFFLPGDSLLFVAGIFSKDLMAYLIGEGGTGSDFVDLIILMILITLCGIVGNMVGYWVGKKSGPFLFTKKDSLLFKKKHLLKAKDFYDKHGGQAIVFARFLPFVRTFAPIVAGIVGMDKKKFVFYNIIGCVAWVFSMVVAGHYLYKLFLNKFNFNLKEHLEAIVIAIILVTTLPVVYKLFFGKKENNTI